MGHHRLQRIARWLVLATVILILYGSLFPFRFSAAGEFSLDAAFRSLQFQRTSRGDLVANILLYLPLGLCLALAWPAHWPQIVRLVSSVAAGTLLSVAIEILQVYSLPRVASLTDVLINAIGTFGGAFVAVLYLQLGSTLVIPGIGARPEPVPLGVLLLWLAFRLAPFVPTIDFQKYKNAVKPLFIDPQFDALDTFRYFVGWMVVSYTVRQLWRSQYLLALLGIIAIVLADELWSLAKSWWLGRS